MKTDKGAGIRGWEKAKKVTKFSNGGAKNKEDMGVQGADGDRAGNKVHKVTWGDGGGGVRGGKSETKTGELETRGAIRGSGR